MVKFSFLALASALAMANAGRTARRTVKLGERKLRRGDPGTEALLKKARPYKRNNAANAAPARRLDGEDFEIDGSYSLKFSQCVDVKTMDEDLFDEDLVEYVQAGQVVSTKSYVLFHVCQGDNCYYESDDDLYLVDLATYLANVAQYHANKRNDYCGACEEFEDVCNVEEEEEAEEDEEEEAAEDEADEDEADEEEADEEEGDEEEEQQDEEQEQEEGEEDEQGDEEEGEENENEENEGEEENQEGEEGEDGEEEGEGEDRKLKKTKRKLSKDKKNRNAITRKLANKNYIDCDQCAAYNCYEDEDDLDDQAVRQEELDENVSDWIGDLTECKESGAQWKGMDTYIGAMCSPYGDGVELAVFVDDECTMYTNGMSFYQAWNPYNDNDDGINYLTYAEEFIKNAFSEVTPCQAMEYADPNEDADDEDEDEDEEYEVNDYCQQVMEGDAVDFNNCAADEEEEDEEDEDDQYNWYTYDMKEADDIDEVCVTMNQMAGEYSYAYDEEASGTWYERNKNGQITNGNDNGFNGLALAPGVIAVIVGVSVLVIGGAAFLLKPKKKPSDSNEPVYQGGTML